MTTVERFDAVIVGAGPAGLTAATYLGRFRRRVLVLDGGTSRAAWIPESHNTPGFPHGIGGEALLRRLRAQAVEYGAVVRAARLSGLQGGPDGFTGKIGEERIEAPVVLLATGVVDRLPAIPGVEAAIRASVARICPICDAFEAIDTRIAVLGDGPLADREAQFLETYSRDVTVLDLGGASGAGRPDTLAVRLEDLAFEGDGFLVRGAGAVQRFEYLYLALGCSGQAEVAVGLGARRDESGRLIVDAHQMTSIKGLYAAGDVVRGLNQISVAVGEAAVAATAIHNRLRGV